MPKHPISKPRSPAAAPRIFGRCPSPPALVENPAPQPAAANVNKRRDAGRRRVRPPLRGQRPHRPPARRRRSKRGGLSRPGALPADPLPGCTRALFLRNLSEFLPTRAPRHGRIYDPACRSCRPGPWRRRPTARYRNLSFLQPCQPRRHARIRPSRPCLDGPVIGHRGG